MSKGIGLLEMADMTLRMFYLVQAMKLLGGQVHGRPAQVLEYIDRVDYLYAFEPWLFNPADRRNAQPLAWAASASTLSAPSSP